MLVWVTRFLVTLSLQNFLKYCIGGNSSAGSNDDSLPRKVMSRAGGLVFLQQYDGFFYDFFLLFITIFFIIMIILINWILALFVLFSSIIFPGRVITKIAKTKNHEKMKATERLKNQPTKKPYSPQVSRKTTTFYLHESSWLKQLKESISNWISGCNAPQKIGKTAVMKCKQNCKWKTTNGYNTYTSLAFFSRRNWMLSSS